MTKDQLIDILTVEEYSRFQANFKSQRIPSLSFDDFLKVTSNDAVLNRAFTWSETPEGHSYWQNVNDKLQILTTKEPSDKMSVDEIMSNFTWSEWAALCKHALKQHSPKKYIEIMNLNYDSIGQFIIVVLNREKWRGVPNIFKEALKRTENAAWRIVPGKFAEPSNKKSKAI